MPFKMGGLIFYFTLRLLWWISAKELWPLFCSVGDAVIGCLNC